LRQGLVQQKTIVQVGLAPTSLSIILEKMDNFIHHFLNSQNNGITTIKIVISYFFHDHSIPMTEL
jgi:hypothetical protein